jgi:hypothetical protein
MRSALHRVIVSLVLVTTVAPLGLAQSNRTAAGMTTSNTALIAAARSDGGRQGGSRRRRDGAPAPMPICDCGRR